MSNPQSLGDMARRLASMIPGMDAGEQRRRINNAYVNEAMCHPWSFLLKRWTLQTEAAYATGTVNPTNGGTSLTLTGGTWVTSWTTSPSNRRIAMQGSITPYDLTISGAAAGTIADPWIGATTATASYSMWRDTYPLPADCGYGKLMALYDPELGFKIDNKNQSIFLRELMLQPSLVGIPELLMIVNQTSEAPPRPQFRMWPAPATVRAYHGFYFRRPDFMTTDATYPDWPYEFQAMIPLSAAIAHYSTPRFHSDKYLRLFKPDYADLFARAVKAFDGDSAIDVQIEDVFTGAGSRGRSNARWSPGVFGSIGQEMTRS